MQFETHKLERNIQSYIRSRWTDSLVISAVYVFLIFTGRHLMTKRQPFDLRPVRIIWNGALTLFSICGAFVCWREIIANSMKHSLQYSICIVDPNEDYFEESVIWIALFALSKVVELGDTIFIILRKKPLIFLHWYHHTTVLIYVWYSYANYTAAGRWFVAMNFIAHSLVYMYYTLAALRLRIPMVMKILITCAQILQMVVGVSVNAWAYIVKSRKGVCQQTYENMVASSFMYFSYFLLFAHFFYVSYIQRKDEKVHQKKVN